MKITENFTYIGTSQNFERDSYTTLAEMKAVVDKRMPDIFTATCKETGKFYIYNKSNEVNETLGKWREISIDGNDYVTKTYVDTEIAKKADTDHTHTIVNGHTVESNVPADAKFTDTVYDDTEIKAEIAKKADITSIPSKVSELTNDSNYQTAEQVSSTVTTEIAKVVADAPEDLNTLKEMSDWIAGHENDASAMNSAISDNKAAITALQSGKADKSEIPTTVSELTDSADYAKTTDLHSHTNKTVLDGITSTKVSNWDSAKTHADSAHAPSNAQANVIETVKVNGTALTPSSKAVNVIVPTKVSELTDSADYAKKTDIPTTLPANGGNADTVNNHTVKSDVPENAVFTDTVYDDTEVKESIDALINDTASSTTSTYSSDKIDKKLNGTSITVSNNANGFSYYSIAYGDSYTESGNQGILIQHNRLNFSPTTYLFTGTIFNIAEVRYFITKISGNTDKAKFSQYAIDFYLDKEAGILYLKIPTYSRVSLTDLLVQSNEITATKVDAIPGTATKMTVIEYASTASLANYSIPLNLYMGTNHYLAIKANVHNMNYYFNMSDRSGNIYEGAFFSYNGSFSIQIKKVNNSSTKNGYILGFRQYKVSDNEIYLVAKVSDYNYINGVINAPSVLKSNIEILVNDDSTLWNNGTDVVVKEVGYINDSSTGDTNSTWSSSKINSSLNDKAKKYEQIEYSTSAIYVNDEFITNMMDYVFSVLKEKEPSTLGGGVIKVVELNKYFMFQGYCSSSNLTGTVYEVINSGRTWSYYFTATGQNVVKELATMDKLGGLTFSASGTTLSITDGTHTWTLEANS